MGRFSDLVPSAGRYVNAEAKAMLADLGVPLRLVRSTYQPRATFGPRWLVDVKVVGTNEDVAIDFAAATKAGDPIEARMGMFAELRDRLDAGEAFDPVVLVKVSPAKGGNPFWTFADATPAQLASPAKPEWPPEDESEPEPVVIPGERLRRTRSRRAS